MSKLRYVLLAVFLITISSANLFNITDYSFKCTNSSGNYTVKEYFICDKHPDCANGEDEDLEMCQNRTCRNGNFRCDSGQCVSAIGHCYLHVVCKDGSRMSELDCHKKYPSVSRRNCPYRPSNSSKRRC